MLPSVGVSSDIDIHEADVLGGLYERVKFKVDPERATVGAAS